MRYLVIMNPAAGRGRQGRSPHVVESAFRQRRLSFEFVVTNRAGHAAELIAARGAEFARIVAVGGDGTVHETIQNLDLGRHRFGLIPWGSGNDFAWNHGWPQDLHACLDRIVSGSERRIDVGFWEGESAGETLRGRFHNSVGMGFEADVNAESHRIQKLKGALVYVVALARTLPRYRNYPVRMTWEGGSFEGMTSLLSIANGKRVGGCFLIAPDADPADRLLDLVYAEEMGLARALLLAPRILRGSHLTSPRVHIRISPWVQVESKEGIPVYVDGEFVGHDLRTVTMKVEKEALRTS
jgi:YegS/Rv2252/BmrU family lipid kinase